MLTKKQLKALSEAMAKRVLAYTEHGDYKLSGVEARIHEALTAALEEDRTSAEAAIRCLPSFAPSHAHIPESEFGVFQVRLEAVCALVRNGAT